MRIILSFDEQTEKLLTRAVVALESLPGIKAALEKLAVDEAPSPFAVEFYLLLGGITDMQKGKVFGGSRSGRSAARAGAPTPITDAPTGQKIAVVGVDAQGVLGAQLAPGASILITVANGANGVAATFVADASPAPVSFVDANGKQQNSVPSLVSGVLTAAQPIDPNDPFVVSYAITNADGSAGDTGSGTATIVPGVEASEVLVLQAS